MRAKDLLNNYIRVRITDADRAFIERFTTQSGKSISDVLRDLISKLKEIST